MTIYIKAPAIVTRAVQAANPGRVAICDGCNARGENCCRVSATITSTCGYDFIWIEDTEQARVDYITMKLEYANGNARETNVGRTPSMARDTQTDTA